MIVYAGKQFWNDFNNWDEGVFQDANRPRDFDKFKLRPWLQSDKWDWRGSNKNISMQMAQLIVKWGAVVPWTSDGSQLYWVVPQIQEKWTASEISNIGRPYSIDDLTVQSFQYEKANNPCAVTRTGSITYQQGTSTTTQTWQYIEIIKPWLYIVQASAQFFFPSSYDSTSSYKYKEWVGICQENDWVFMPIIHQSFRSCGNGEGQMSWQISWFTQGTKLVPICAHNFTSGTTFVFQALNLVRLQ